MKYMIGKMGFSNNRRAQVSFAALAILLLVLGGLSTVYFQSSRRQQLQSLKATGELRFLDDRVESCHSCIQRDLEGLLEDLLVERLLDGSFDRMGFAEAWEDITEEFNRRSEGFLSPNEGLGRYEIEVNDHVLTAELPAYDFDDAVTNTEFSDDCLDQDDLENAGPDTYKTRSWGPGKTSVYPAISGHVNYTARSMESGRTLQRSIKVSATVRSPVALLDERLGDLSRSCEGSSGEVARMTGYILNTLAQFRVLQGETSSDKIIGQDDADLAVRLALFLEAARTLRCSVPSLLPQGTGNDDLRNLVESYCGTGSVDVADIAGLYLKLDGQRLNLESILSQALNTLVDQFVLKYLDYLGILPLAEMIVDFGEYTLDKLKDVGGAVSDYLFGKDDKEKDKVEEHEVVKNLLGIYDIETVFEPVDISLGGNDFLYTIMQGGTASDADGESRSYKVERTYRISLTEQSVTIPFEPVDLFADDMKDTWDNIGEEFCEKKYDEESGKIRTALRRMIEELVGTGCRAPGVRDVIDMHNSPVDLEPTDDETMMETLSNRYDCFFDELSESMGSNEVSQIIKEILKECLNPESDNINVLVLLVNSNLDKFADVDHQRDLAREAISKALISGSVAIEEIIWQPEEAQHWNIELETLTASDVLETGKPAGGEDMESLVDKAIEASKIDTVDEKASDEKWWEKTLSDLKEGGPLRNIICGGIGEVVEASGFLGCGIYLSKTITSEMMRSQIMRNDAVRSISPLDVPFQFSPGDIWDEELRTELAGDGLSISSDIGKPEGVHHTDPKDLSTRPFETVWDISFSGSMALAVSTVNGRVTGPDGPVNTALSGDISLDFNVVVWTASGWELGGVDYRSSDTLWGDLKDFLGKVWEKVAGFLDRAWDGVQAFVDFVKDAKQTIMKCASKILEWIGRALNYLVQSAMNFVKKVLGGLIEDLCDWVKDWIGEGSLEFKLFGFRFLANVPKDVPGDGITPQCRLEVSKDWKTNGLCFWVEFVEVNGDADVLVGTGLDLWGREVSFTLDPLMKVMGTCLAATIDGESWGMELSVPDVEDVDIVRFVPVELPPIPVPLVGRAYVEFGAEMKLARVIEDRVVINEVVPPTDDSPGWVELARNPSVGYDLSGWYLESRSDPGARMVLGELDWEYVDYEPCIYQFIGLAKVELKSGSDISVCDGLVLRNGDGVVDRTPRLDGVGPGQGLSRLPDLGPTWTAAKNTMGKLNGEDGELSGSDLVLAAVDDARREAISGGIPLSWDEFKTMVRAFLTTLLDNLADLAQDVLVEFLVYIQVILASQSGPGFRISFVIAGDVICDILRWLSDLVNRVLDGPDDPMRGANSFPSTNDLAQGLSIRFEALFNMEVPKTVKDDQTPDDLQGRVRIEANLAALGALFGKSWGTWEVRFGVLFTGSTGGMAKNLFNTHSKNPDVWLLRGTIHGK